METKPLLLIVEDEKHIRTFLRISLSSQGYRTIEADNAVQALTMSRSHVPDLIVLDLGLPDRDGLDVLREVRVWSNVPILILSAHDQEKDKVTALDLGADDYLTKPFGVDELFARVRVSLRHAARFAPEDEGGVFRCAELEVDLRRREVRRGSTEIHLTPIEYRILSILVENAGRVVTHRHLLQEVWGPESQEQNQYLRVFMAALRRKIEADPSRPRYLVTEVGVGYRLADEADR